MLIHSGLGGRHPRTQTRRLSPAGKAGRNHGPRARRLSPAGQAGGAPCTEAQTRLAGFSNTVAHAWMMSPPGWLVYTRVPSPSPVHPEVESRRAGLSTPATLYRRLSPRGQADGAPRREAESRCEGCWRRAALARRLSPTGQAGGAPCSEAQYVCAAWRSPTPGGRVPPCRLVDHRGLSQEAQFCRGGWWSPMFGSSVPPGRLVEPRSPAPAG